MGWELGFVVVGGAKKGNGVLPGGDIQYKVKVGTLLFGHPKCDPTQRVYVYVFMCVHDFFFHFLSCVIFLILFLIFFPL